DEALDLRALDNSLALLLELASNHQRSQVNSLVDVVELADLAGPLWSEALWHLNVGEAGDLVVALLEDDKVEHGEIRSDDAAADGLALALTSAARAVAAHALLE